MLGRATYDSCIRFLNEDPWERLRTFRKLMPNSRLQMLLRGQNLPGLSPLRGHGGRPLRGQVGRERHGRLPVFDRSTTCATSSAMDSRPSHRETAEGTICYTTSPLHTVEKFVEMAQRLKDMGSDSICIKDMAALLRPQPAYEIVKGIKEKCGEDTIVHVHVHSTTGVTMVSLMKAIEAGADIVDTSISSLSLAPATTPPRPSSRCSRARATPPA